jgi:hypothetical protein
MQRNGCRAKKIQGVLETVENEYKINDLAMAMKNVPLSYVGTNKTYIPRINLPNYGKLKGRTVKCTLVQALRLFTGRTADRGSRGIALPCHDHGTRRG